VSKPTLDFTPFQAALGTKLAIAVKKNRAAADIVNDAGLKILVGFKGGEGLVQLTRKATVARITADLNKPVVGRTNAVRLKSGKTRAGRPQTKPLLFWLALQVMKRTGAGNIPEIVKQTMAAILKMRIKSRAYIAAGWLFAAKDLFEKSPGKHKFTRLMPRNIPTVETGTAATSFAVPAIPGRTTLTLVNTSRGGGTVGMEYAQQAINNATADIQVYIDREAGKQFANELFKTLKIA
jgi:hypothetical protein